MSLTQLRSEGAGQPVARMTADRLLEKKRLCQPITALTAYDFPTARLVDEAGIDVILVGDSVGMAVLGYENTLPVTMDEMLHHTRAVARGVRRALLIADMPYGSYQVSVEAGVANGIRFMKEAGAHGVKVEGGLSRVELVRRLTEAEVPVVGHIGLTPQSVHRMGGYSVQGKSLEAIDRLMLEADALAEAGAIAIVLECVPREVAAKITGSCSVPTIGIGAGPECDGQILVFHDLMGLTFSHSAKFSRRYADAGALFSQAIAEYREDVTGRAFPSDAESYHLPRTLREVLEDEVTA